ncbi:MAG: Indole-3-glycerol phosphate synthase [Labilithrix sp.]|nr:Indole-3-glycerol phosphate synthase [Labilithrix sp.]
MTNVLDKILQAKREEIAALAGVRPSPRSSGGPRGASVVSRLVRQRSEPLRLVTEIKRRSPSAGPLSTKLSVAERALAYARGGAAMISVLCDARFFDGGWSHLAEARAALDAAALATPLLAKEFVLDGRQIEEAAASGADAVLLIARIVDHVALAVLVRQARALGLEPLVEVVTEDELSAALDADAKVIGVNARDLDTLEMDAPRAARVLSRIPDDRVAIHLSGLKGPDDVAAVAKTRADAALMGEALMRKDDPGPLLRSMIDASFARDGDAP